MTTSSFNDQRIEVMIGNLLRAGVLLAAAVVAAGRGDLPDPSRHAAGGLSHFPRRSRRLRTVPAIVRGRCISTAKSIIQLGLLLLIATPVARVMFSVVAFAIERDYLYVVITLIVLAVLLYSLLGSGVA